MTLLSRKKPQTTARRITPLTLAASIVMLALGVAPIFAQQPAARPNFTQSPPSGYRTRTPTPPQTQRATTPPTAFATAGNSEVVPAQANTPVPAIPDLPAPPPPPESRYGVPQSTQYLPSSPVAFNGQAPAPPMTSTSNKQGSPVVPEEYIKLPPRESIFMVYDDPQLERAIMERIIEDRIAGQKRRIKEIQDDIKKLTKPEDIKKLEETIPPLEVEIAKDEQALKDPAKDPTYRFPASPVISPPGVAYRPKTPNYPPHQAILEPGYVVHRKLHFEEPNAERVGWDLGPMQTLLSAGYFFRDTLLLPQSVVSGWCRGPWDTNAGKCLPGSTSPYYLYPLGLTVSGTAFETITAVGLGFAFFP